MKHEAKSSTLTPTPTSNNHTDATDEQKTWPDGQKAWKSGGRTLGLYGEDL